MEKEIKLYLSKKLSGKRQFTTSELKALLHHVNPQVSKSAHAWWINKLKNDGFFTQLGRGLYTFQPKLDYRPELSRKAKQFYNKARKFLPEGTPLLIYESLAIANLLGVEPTKHYIFMLVPREQLEFFFYDIQPLGKRVFIKPGREVTQRYILPFFDAIMLYPMLSEMPTIELNGYTTLSIEGVLVHSLTFGQQYYQTRNIELKQVFQIAFDRYNVNISKLLRYAARREKRKQIKELLNQLDVI